MNDGVVSMGARVEVTKRLRRAYRGASKKEKGRVLDSFCESTGLSRATARRYLTSDTTGNPGVVRIDYRKARATKYSTMAKRILQRVWVLSECQRGKHLAVSIRVWLDSLETHEELVIGRAERTSDCLSVKVGAGPRGASRGVWLGGLRFGFGFTRRWPGWWA